MGLAPQRWQKSCDCRPHCNTTVCPPEHIHRRFLLPAPGWFCCGSPPGARRHSVVARIYILHGERRYGGDGGGRAIHFQTGRQMSNPLSVRRPSLIGHCSIESRRAAAAAASRTGVARRLQMALLETTAEVPPTVLNPDQVLRAAPASSVACLVRRPRSPPAARPAPPPPRRNLSSSIPSAVAQSSPNSQ